MTKIKEVVNIALSNSFNNNKLIPQLILEFVIFTSFVTVKSV